ncbi:hypothetical protein ACWOAN_02145 [Lactococcus taiwanensis]|uniref:hypothetical protein n=1 Tax=Lactococcus taiwanensis TaxID=1151742 RepID=UPI001905FF1E|nr:hypothetical protein [Lactococcus taiwanensis]
MKEKMIYDFSTYGLYYENKIYSDNNPTFSLLLGTLELEYDFKNMELIGVSGYLPILEENKEKIVLENIVQENIVLQLPRNTEINVGDVWSLFDISPQMKKYFAPLNISYDGKKGIIQLGVNDKGNKRLLKVTNNIFCKLDNKGVIKCLFIHPDSFINEPKG